MTKGLVPRQRVIMRSYLCFPFELGKKSSFKNSILEGWERTEQSYLPLARAGGGSLYIITTYRFL